MSPLTPVDLWSVGCILAELLGRRPLFKGRDYVDQLNQILYYLGTPTDDMLARVASPRAQQYIKSLPYKPRIPFEQLYPDANPLALDLLRRLLAFDPAERITCDEALRHPYLAVWHDPADEPVCASKFDFSFEQVDDIEGMKKIILNEVISFRREVRLQAQARQQMMHASAESAANVVPTASQIPPRDSPYEQTPPRRQDTLPVPSRTVIERSAPAQPNYSILGEPVNAHGDGGEQLVGEHDAMEHPHESLHRQLSHYYVHPFQHP